MKIGILLLLIFLGFLEGYLNAIGPDSRKFFRTKNCDDNCTFKFRNISKSTIGAFPASCETVCADIFIDQNSELSEEQLAAAFKSMKHLIGGFLIYNTQFTSSRFLAGLESIETDYPEKIIWEDNYRMEELGLTNLTSITSAGLIIFSGEAMKRLNLPNLKAAKTTSPKYAEVEIETRFMNSNFCITFNEMENLMSIDNVDLTFIEAIYCTPTSEDRVCTTPAEGCTRIYGDVEIAPNFDFKLMKNVESIFGTLIINGTELSNLSFLENLKYVAPLGWKPAGLNTPARGERKYAIVIEDNLNLVNYTFPKLKRARGDQSYIIVLDNNNEELTYNYEMCFQLKNQLNTTKNPSVDGSICDHIKLKAASRDTGRKDRIILGLIILAAVILLFALIACCCCCKKSQRRDK